jgi:hypothetical protein
MQLLAGRNRHPRALVAAVLALGASSATVGTTQAHAGSLGYFCDRYVNQAELCRGPFVNTLRSIVAENRTDGHAVCIAPVGWNGNYTFPYGWECAQAVVGWTFPPLYGAPGADNPNSSKKLIYGLYTTVN